MSAQDMKSMVKHFGLELAIAREWMAFCQQERYLDELEIATQYYFEITDKRRELIAVLESMQKVSHITA